VQWESFSSGTKLLLKKETFFSKKLVMPSETLLNPVIFLVSKILEKFKNSVFSEITGFKSVSEGITNFFEKKVSFFNKSLVPEEKDYLDTVNHAVLLPKLQLM
jgi:hypothetical protein